MFAPFGDSVIVVFHTGSDEHVEQKCQTRQPAWRSVFRSGDEFVLTYCVQFSERLLGLEALVELGVVDIHIGGCIQQLFQAEA
jgi:hypothetical protein